MDTLIMSKLFLFSSCCTGRMTGFGDGMNFDTFITSFVEIWVCNGTNVDKSDLDIEDVIGQGDEMMLDGTIVILQDCGDTGGVVHTLDENWLIGRLERFEFSNDFSSHGTKLD